ncbi:hypothetical protein K8R32_04535 [bacterium]|nr:hypothetical protein [bacterium]
MTEHNYKHIHGWEILFGKILVVVGTIGLFFALSYLLGYRLEKTNIYPKSEFSEETKLINLKIAQDFILDSPTYNFDGYGLKQVMAFRGQCPGCWSFVYEFNSKYNGFGDRMNIQAVPLAIVHQANINIEYGKVIYADIDSVWDMIEQKIITIEKQPATLSSKKNVYKIINLKPLENE